MNIMDVQLESLVFRIETAIKWAFDAGLTDAQIARAVADATRTYGLRARVIPEYDWRTDPRTAAARDRDADRDRNWDGK